MAAFPSRDREAFMTRLGAPKDSIAIWDASSAKGLAEAGSRIKQATESFMVGRAAGVRGTRSVFGTGIDVVNKRTVSKNLTPLKSGAFQVLDSNTTAQIRDFVTAATGTYVRGNAYYQLRKRETIQPSKNVIIVERSTGKAYTGDAVRPLLGLPDGEYVDVRPDHNPNYDIFVQSTSVNRKVTPSDKVLVLA